jgi:hypothetical protein
MQAPHRSRESSSSLLLPFLPLQQYLRPLFQLLPFLPPQCHQRQALQMPQV